jgi:hypothetical protein
MLGITLRRNNVLAWGRRAGKTTFGSDLVIETVIDQRQPLGWFAPDFKILDPVWNYYVNLFAPLTVDKDETKRYLELHGRRYFRVLVHAFRGCGPVQEVQAGNCR